MPLEFQKISFSRLKFLPTRETVFFFPVGPLEDHGPHLPMGLDIEESVQLCWLAAERLEKEKSGWTGVVMPSAPLGVEGNTSEGAIRVRAFILRDWLVDACQSLARLGFLNFVCFSGHLGPRQLTAIEEAGNIVRFSHFLGWMNRWVSPWRASPTRPALISACSALVSARQVRAAPFRPDPSEHGGRRDTSVALALGRGVVLDPRFQSLPSQERAPSSLLRGWRYWRNQTSGFWGTPADASEREGHQILQGTLDDIFPKLRAVWEGANPNYLFRSWYSILPPNRPYFKLGILALALLVFFAAWVYLNYRDL